MSSETKNKDPHETSTNTEDHALNRRNLLLGTSTLVAAATMTSGALAQAQKAAPAAQPGGTRFGRKQAEYPSHLGG